MVDQGTFKIIRAGGLEEARPFQGDPLTAIIGALGFSLFDAVTLTREAGRADIVMLVDDTGFIDGKPENPKATALYRSVCRPGFQNGIICGDVALVHDSDFGGSI